MKRTKCTEEQISYSLNQAETGTPVAEVIRRMGFSEQTFTAGARSTATWALKQLEEENRKLKQLVAVGF